MSVEELKPEKQSREPLRLTRPEDPDWVDMLHAKILQYKLKLRENGDSNVSKKRTYALHLLENVIGNSTISITRKLNRIEYCGFKIAEKFTTDKERLAKSIHKFEVRRRYR